MLTSADLLTLACDLTAGLAAEDRSRRLIAAVERVIPCEAAALLRLDGGDLIPVATSGLVPEIAGRRFVAREHPRLDLILRQRDAAGNAAPLRFAPDSHLADPYDGLMLADPHACARVHACMGCPLIVHGEVVGVLTVDARDPQAFAALDDATVATFAALAAAGLHTAGLIATLESTAQRRETVLRQLVRDERERRGGQLLGTSAAMRRLRGEIDLVAASDLTVLITGETGVGKELVAGAIHAA
ncbi:MAG: sigma 54-interacting transcriptional regulator, partial [Planctomycetes bacterium]|nr:sigma 54-interacting transcriptional regulator [Planctomycetota bacterium]